MTLSPRLYVRMTGADGPIAPPPGLSPSPSPHGSSPMKSDDAPSTLSAVSQGPVAPPPGLGPVSSAAAARAAAARATAAPAPTASEAGSDADDHKKTRRKQRGGTRQWEGPRVRHFLRSMYERRQVHCSCVTALLPCNLATSGACMQRPGSAGADLVPGCPSCCCVTGRLDGLIIAASSLLGRLVADCVTLPDSRGGAAAGPDPKAP